MKIYFFQHIYKTLGFWAKLKVLEIPVSVGAVKSVKIETELTPGILTYLISY